MPAIHLAKLKQQAALLSNNFDQPKVFIRELHDMLDIYAERSHRPGQSGAPPPLIHSYNVPKPVLRQILIELAPLVTSRPGEALSLCDALWEEPYLEFRLLAASILGLIPADPPDPIFIRVEKWGRSITDDQILTELMQQGLASVRHESIEILIDIPESRTQQILLPTPVKLRGKIIWQKHHKGYYSTGARLLFANPIIIKHVLSLWKKG